MTDVNMQQLAALAERIGTPVWHAALRQVWTSITVDAVWLVVSALLMWTLVRWTRKREVIDSYDDNLWRVIRGVVLAVGTVTLGALATDMLTQGLNPTYAALQYVGHLLP